LSVLFFIPAASNVLKPKFHGFFPVYFKRVHRFETQNAGIRLLALLCLLAVLAVSIVAPVHDHSSRQEANCLICHAAERATVVHIDTDAGKSYDHRLHGMVAALHVLPIPEPPNSIRSSRAPPSLLLSL
jgi:hypothetical protein